MLNPRRPASFSMGLHVVDRRVAAEEPDVQHPDLRLRGTGLLAEEREGAFRDRMRVADEARRELDVDDFRVVASTATDQRRQEFPVFDHAVVEFGVDLEIRVPACLGVRLDGAERVDPLVGLRISSG